MLAKVEYLYNSGFTVKTQEHFLIFDYYPYRDKLSLTPEDWEGRKTVVFASHSHYDHYHPCIFQWDQPGMRYVLSSDIRVPDTAPQDRIFSVLPCMDYDLGDLKIKTLRSTDLGTAFLIQMEGVTIYHGGDLNWWHWTGESEEYNQEMSRNYRKEIDSLENPIIDLAFVPLDGRLEETYFWGLDYFMNHTRTKRVVPIHFRDDYSVFDRLEENPSAKGYLDRVQRLSHSEQKFTVELGGDPQ